MEEKLDNILNHLNKDNVKNIKFDKDNIIVTLHQKAETITIDLIPMDNDKELPTINSEAKLNHIQ